MPEKTIPVALARADHYNDPKLGELVGDILDAANLPISSGAKVLVKPNLLMAHKLSCTNPAIVALACKWLLDHNVKPIIADSPAFGSAKSVAKAIGLADALAPLGLGAQNFSKPRTVYIYPTGSKPVARAIAPEALDCDLILSIPRVKAHSQLRVTLSVKNCFGCVCGIHKALAHATPNLTLPVFADQIVALWEALPPVAALCDGIIAMNGTGPRHGTPLHVGAIGACASAPALDSAFLRILGLTPCEIPICLAFARRYEAGDKNVCPNVAFPLLSPEDFPAPCFTAPQKLKNISFNPWVLCKSIIKRLVKI